MLGPGPNRVAARWFEGRELKCGRLRLFDGAHSSLLSLSSEQVETSRYAAGPRTGHGLDASDWNIVRSKMFRLSVPVGTYKAFLPEHCGNRGENSENHLKAIAACVGKRLAGFGLVRAREKW